jgi:2-C-methyl-D-erythritol 4-phosphate cytidylyltransferase
MVKKFSVCAVVLAAGQGKRAGGAKQFRRVAGRSLLYHACAPFLEVPEVEGLVVVVPRGRSSEVTEEMFDCDARKLLSVVVGGKTRHESSRRGLAALPKACEIVLIHDAARPFVSPKLIRRVIAAAREHGAAVPALSVKDATIELDDRGEVERYLPRENLRAVQTPQGFARDRLESAFAEAELEDHADDAGLVLAAGGKLVLVEGEERNKKITSPSDLARAVRILENAARGAQEEEPW